MNQDPQPSGTQATGTTQATAYVVEANAFLRRPDAPQTLGDSDAFLLHVSGGSFFVPASLKKYLSDYKALSPEAQRVVFDAIVCGHIITGQLGRRAAGGEATAQTALLLEAEDEAACSTMSPAMRATQRALAVAMASTDDLAAQQRLALFNALTLSEPHLKIALREAKGHVGAFGQGVALVAQMAVQGKSGLDNFSSFAPILAGIVPPEVMASIASLFGGIARPPQGAPSAVGSVGCCAGCASPESVAASVRPPSSTAESPNATPSVPAAEAPLSVAQAAGGETVAFPADAPLEDTAPPQAP